jgi:Protein of unknown function (DUF4239)
MIARLLIMAGCVVVALAGAALGRRRVSHDLLVRNQAFTGITYQIVGAVYGVYLAFTIVVVWQGFDQAEQSATAEAVHLSEVWRDVQVLPTAERRRVEQSIRDYAEAVVQREWPAMARGEGVDAEAQRRYDDVWETLYAVRAKASGPGDAQFFGEAIEQMNTVGLQRRMRLLDNDSELPAVVWTLLIGGGLTVIAFSYFIGVPHAGMQAGVTAALTALIVFCLLLVAALQHPFVGDIGIQPTAYQTVLRSLHDRLQQDLLVR